MKRYLIVSLVLAACSKKSDDKPKVAPQVAAAPALRSAGAALGSSGAGSASGGTGSKCDPNAARAVELLGYLKKITQPLLTGNAEYSTCEDSDVLKGYVVWGGAGKLDSSEEGAISTLGMGFGVRKDIKTQVRVGQTWSLVNALPPP